MSASYPLDQTKHINDISETMRIIDCKIMCYIKILSGSKGLFKSRNKTYIYIYIHISTGMYHPVLTGTILPTFQRSVHPPLSGPGVTQEQYEGGNQGEKSENSKLGRTILKGY
jgi:hypothetical protein